MASRFHNFWKRYMRYILFLFISYGSLAQEILPPISLRSHSIKDFDARAIGDSVLLTWYAVQHATQSKLVYRFIIKPDKTVQTIGLPGTIENIVNIDDQGDKLNIISLSDEKKATVFLEFTYDKARKSLSTPREFFRTSTKKIIGIVPGRELLVLAEDNKQDTLVVTRIQKSRQVDEQRFFIQDQVLQLWENDFGLIPMLRAQADAIFHQGVKVSSFQACADLKFYIEGRNLTIVRDQPKKAYQQFKGYTTVISIDLDVPGSMQTTIVGERNLNTFSSYFFDGHLFRFGMDRVNLEKEFSLAIFKGDSLRRRIEFKKDLFYMIAGKYYKRSDFSVSEKFKCVDAFSGSIPFVQPEYAGSGKISLKIGSYELPNKTPGPISAMNAKPSSIGIKTPEGPQTIPVEGDNRGYHTSMTSNFADSYGVERYLYLYGDVENGFDYSQGQGHIDHQIDAYEMNKSNEGKFKLKRYLKTKNYTYAFYRKRGSEEIEVVRFNNVR
jgi:hypothetical protein